MIKKYFAAFAAVCAFVFAVLPANAEGGLSDLDKLLGAIANELAPTDRVTGQHTVNSFNRAEQIQKGDANARALILELSKQKVRMGKDASEKQHDRLQKVFNRVLAVSHFRDERWTPVLIVDPGWNAFVHGGTYAFFYLGLMIDLKSDDELAAVIAHEIAHVAANHVFEQHSHTQLAGLLGSKSTDRQHFQAAFNHEQEEEADKIGVLYMALAGYDPYAASRVWWKVFLQEGDSNRMIRTHPRNSARLQNNHAVAQQVQQYYTPGVRNSNFAQLLRKNVLWNAEKSGPAAGSGGGLLALAEGVADHLLKHNEAKLEEARQQYEFARNQPPSILWTMGDSCNDGRKIDYRFFGYEGGQITGVWPNSDQVYRAENFNHSDNHTLHCKVGSKICYGGESVGGNTLWGIGLDGRTRCSDCCFNCPQYGQFETATNMTC